MASRRRGKEDPHSNDAADHNSGDINNTQLAFTHVRRLGNTMRPKSASSLPLGNYRSCRFVSGDMSVAIRRILPVAIWVSLAGFCGLMVAAMVVYPGGNAFDVGADGYQFWRNFWCDLTGTLAQNGEPNAAIAWAQGASVSLAAGLAAVWGSIWTMSGGPDWAKGVVVCGVLASLCMVGVSVGPEAWHDTFTASAGIFAFMAAIPSVIFLARRARTRITASTAMALSLLNMVTWLFWPTSAALPVIQKVATGAVLVWMAAVAAAARDAEINPLR